MDGVINDGGMGRVGVLIARHEDGPEFDILDGYIALLEATEADVRFLWVLEVGCEEGVEGTNALDEELKRGLFVGVNVIERQGECASRVGVGNDVMDVGH